MKFFQNLVVCAVLAWFCMVGLVTAYAAPSSTSHTSGYGDIPFSETQVGMNIQSWHDYLSADKKLNAVYAVLLGKLDAPSANRLKAAERAWLAFRDADSKYYAARYTGGTVYPMQINGWCEGMTEDRIDQLKAIIRSRPERRTVSPDVAARFDDADKKLNAVYLKLLAIEMGNGESKELKTSEKAWIAFRDAEARFESGNDQGTSDGSPAYRYALYSLTVARIADLKSDIKWDKSF